MTDTPKRKTLAELRQSEHTGPIERSQDICVAGGLLAELEELDNQFRAVYNDRADAEPPSNARGADGPSEARQIAERMDAVRAEMAKHMVTVRVGRIPPHDWREWARQHPPRIQEDRHVPGCDRDDCDGCLPNRDDAIAGVNLDDLVDDLARHVTSLNGDKPGPGDWEFVVENAADGDLVELARKVAGIHLSAVGIPKSRLDWLDSQRNDAASR